MHRAQDLWCVMRAQMTGAVQVWFSTLSGDQCSWCLPVSATLFDIRRAVQTRFGVRPRCQRFVTGTSVAARCAPLSRYGKEDLEFMIVASEPACQTCGVSGKLRRCGGCNDAYYCSTTCQAQHWPEHRSHCKRDLPTGALSGELQRLLECMHSDASQLAA